MHVDSPHSRLIPIRQYKGRLKYYFRYFFGERGSAVVPQKVLAEVEFQRFLSEKLAV